MSTSLGQLQADIGANYTIEREIGRAGMATVYLARDVRHDRPVAIKVLDPELAASVGADRFLGEIRTLANLQHPNVLPLFDSGAAGGTLFYVMPFVPGETLRTKLDRERQLPVDEALRITNGIAAALEHAHRHGIVHRDLKPENILLADGEPVVADFGIALAIDRARSERYTLTGLSLGTPAYMSPEQATGERDIDARSDIFSLGSMLYEMLTGETPFAAATGQATIARIVTETPRPIVRATVPGYVSGAVAKALQKIPADRWRSAREFSDALRGGATTAMAMAPARRPTWTQWAMMLAWIPVLFAVALMVYLRKPAERGDTPSTVRFPLVTSDSEAFLATVAGIPLAISSDDRRVAYVGGLAVPHSRLYVRGLDDMVTAMLAGTEGGYQPVFSPDGQSIAFINGGRIARVSVSGGPVSTILTFNDANAGMEWISPDTLLASIGGGLRLIPVNGGTSVQLSRPDTAHGESAQWGPHRITDRFVAYVSVNPSGYASNRVATIDLRTHATHLSTEHGTTVLGAIDGNVIWVTASGEIMGAPLQRDGTLGSARRLLEDVMVRSGGAAKAVLSKRGTLIYQRGLAVSQLAFVDRNGVARVLPAEEHAYWHPRLSPDGSRIAVRVVGPGTSDIWSIDARTGAGARLTSANAAYDSPEWTPDGKRIIYRAVREAGVTMESMAADGSEIKRMIPEVRDTYSGQLSPDGKWLVYRLGDTERDAYRSIAYRPAAGGREQLFVGEDHAALDPRFSPDGKWLAYMSTAHSFGEVLVKPFPGPGAAVQVSVDGGSEPSWSRDGRTLYYRAGRRMMAASVSDSPGGFSVTGRVQLFNGYFLTDGVVGNYDVTADGKTFLMLQPVDRQAATIVVYGWAHEVRAGLAAK